VVIGFADEMETDTGWIVGGPDDSASRGIWERVDPEPTPAQPGDDTTVNGSLCWVTDGRAGPNIGSFDVDGGITTLTSPPFSTLPPPGFSGEAWITFDVWYSNNQGSAPNADSMPVELSTDGGTTWLPALDISENRGVWWRTRIPIAAPSAQTRVRFIARDLEAGSIVEAAVDELRVEFRGCRTGDFNQDGGIDGDDIIAFFSAWETGQPAADYTLDGGVDGDDVVFFFNLWDSGR
jgi:aminopeptidase S